jgi:hypothetical protein
MGRKRLCVSDILFQFLRLGGKLPLNGAGMQLDMKFCHSAKVTKGIPGFVLNNLQYRDTVHALVYQTIAIINANDLTYSRNRETICMNRSSNLGFFIDVFQPKPVIEKFEHLPLMPGVDFCRPAMSNGLTEVFIHVFFILVETATIAVVFQRLDWLRLFIIISAAMWTALAMILPHVFFQ